MLRKRGERGLGGGKRKCPEKEGRGDTPGRITRRGSYRTKGPRWGGGKKIRIWGGRWGKNPDNDIPLKTMRKGTSDKIATYQSVFCVSRGRPILAVPIDQETPKIVLIQEV